MCCSFNISLFLESYIFNLVLFNIVLFIVNDKILVFNFYFNILAPKLDIH